MNVWGRLGTHNCFLMILKHCFPEKFYILPRALNGLMTKIHPDKEECIKIVKIINNLILAGLNIVCII